MKIGDHTSDICALFFVLFPHFIAFIKMIVVIKYNRLNFTVSKIVRVIRQPRGNMLLIGFGGSGRQSLTRLAAHICTYDTFQIEVSKNYRKMEFREGQSAHLLCIKIHNKQRT